MILDWGKWLWLIDLRLKLKEFFVYWMVGLHLVGLESWAHEWNDGANQSEAWFMAMVTLMKSFCGVLWWHELIALFICSLYTLYFIDVYLNSIHWNRGEKMTSMAISYSSTVTQKSSTVLPVMVNLHGG